MLLPGHVGGSYLVGVACSGLFRRQKDASGRRITALVLFTLGAGLISDIDIIPVLFRAGWDTFGQTTAGEHRASILHTPVFAIALGLATLAVPLEERRVWATAACAAVLGHLVMDSVTIGPGVMWLYPWSDAFYGLNLANTRYGTDWGDAWMQRYVRHPLFLIEVALLGAAAIVARRRATA